MIAQPQSPYGVYQQPQYNYGYKIGDDDGNPNGFIPGMNKEKTICNKYMSKSNFRLDLTNYVSKFDLSINTPKECDYVLSLIEFDELFEEKDSNTIAYCITQEFKRLFNLQLNIIEITNLCKKHM